MLGNEHLPLPGRGGASVTPFNAVNDMVAYSKLSDAIFDRIACSSGPELQKSRALLLQVKRRQLYKYPPPLPTLPTHPSPQQHTAHTADCNSETS